MNLKHLQISGLLLLTSVVGAVPSLEAADQVLVPTIVVTDDWVDQKQAILCGKAEESVSACQDAFRNCEAGIDKIMSNAHSVCYAQPNECKIVDVTTTHFTQTAYNLLVRTPIDNYANSAEVAILKNCNAQPPVAAPAAPAETAEEARKRQEQRDAEAGIIPAAPEAAPAANGNEAPAAPANANNDQGAAVQQDAVAPQGAAASQGAAGGCSLRPSK